jgi:hypothetical protein
MEPKKSITNTVIENRFGIILFLLRLGGASIFTDKTSRFSFVYNCTLNTCAYSFFAAMIMAFIVHKDGLQRAMKIFRVILASITIFWILLNIR